MLVLQRTLGHGRNTTIVTIPALNSDPDSVQMHNSDIHIELIQLEAKGQHIKIGVKAHPLINIAREEIMNRGSQCDE